MATIHTFTGNEVIATEVPKYLNDNFSALNTETVNLSKSVVKTINSKSPVNGNINIAGFDSYWEANEQVSVGEIRFPNGRDNSGVVLECVQTGTTGNTQPIIPEIVGMGLTVQDIQTLLTAIEQVQSLNGQTANKITGISDYIVESYRNGTEWYEVYKSGKVRQGGSITSEFQDSTKTVTLLKRMANTKYNVLATKLMPSSSHANVAAGEKTVENFKVIAASSYHTGSTCVEWQVEGQGA